MSITTSEITPFTTIGSVDTGAVRATNKYTNYVLIAFIFILILLVFASYYWREGSEKFGTNTYDTDYHESQAAPINSMKIEVIGNACRHKSILKNRVYVSPYDKAKHKKKVRWANSLVKIAV